MLSRYSGQSGDSVDESFFLFPSSLMALIPSTNERIEDEYRKVHVAVCVLLECICVLGWPKG